MTASGTGSDHPWRRRAAFAAWALLIFTAAWLTGRRAATGPGPLTRAYDVRELLVEIPDFDNPPQFGLRHTAPLTGAPLVKPTTRTVDDRAGDLARLIRQTIAPDTWAHRPHSITPLAGQLVITQIPETHARIAELIREFREARQIQIMVAAKVITLDEPLLRQLPSPLRERLLSDPPTGAASATPLDDVEVLAIVDAIRTGGPSASVVTAPRLTLSSGQRAYVMVSNQRAYVANVSATSTPTGQWALTPDVATVDAGALFDVRVAASPDRKSVTLDLRQQISQLVSMDSTTAATAPTGLTLNLQRPTILLQTLRAPVTIADRKTAIVSGFTTETMTTRTTGPTTQTTTAPSPSATRTFLLVTPMITSQPASPTDRIFPRPN